MAQGGASVAWAGLGLAVIAVVATGFLLWPQPARPPSASRRPARTELGRASAVLLSGVLADVELSMSLSDVLRGHPRIARHPPADREGLRAYQESLGEDRRALYFFAPSPPQLLRVQLADKLDGDTAVVSHVLEVQARLGTPSGVWDCPAGAGQLPTRRYHYRRGAASAVDVIALLGQHAAATFYVAGADQIRHSLAEAQCQPAPPERAGRFPALPPPQ